MEQLTELDGQNNQEVFYLYLRVIQHLNQF